jgi:hypothetical protein
MALHRRCWIMMSLFVTQPIELTCHAIKFEQQCVEQLEYDCWLAIFKIMDTKKKPFAVDDESLR